MSPCWLEKIPLPGTKRLLTRFVCAAFVVCELFTAFGQDLKVLPGYVPQAVSRLAAKGSLPATNEMWLAIGVQMRDRAGLEKFVADVSNPKSPNYRHFLSREALTSQFGPTEEDYQAVKNFALTNGLTIRVAHANRLLLDVTGPVSAVEKALHVHFHTYRHPTEARDFYAPDAEPSLDLKLPVADIEGLTDFQLPYPKWRKGGGGSPPGSKTGSAPDGSGCFFGNDFRNAYVPGSTLTGAGQSVGFIEFEGIYTNDLFRYAKAAGNGRTNITIETVLIDNYDGMPTDDAGEVELDIEMAMAIAPGLDKIVSFEAGRIRQHNDVLNAMLAYSNILNLSCSWGWSGGPSPTTDAIILSMDAVGQSFFDAVGDVGAYTAGSNSVNSIDGSQLGNAPGSNPYMTQVGGTRLKMTGTGVAWANELVWNWGEDTNGSYFDSGASSGGVSSYYLIPDWQTNVGDLIASGGSTQYRNVPDVAACADNIYEVYNNGTNKGGLFDGVGGTSAAAPLWAGFMALVNQQSLARGGPPAGFINPTLYDLGTGPNYASYFHDVTSGSNAWAGSPDLFYATNGYDLCTGLGSMNGTNLINALAPIPAPALVSPVVAAGKITITWHTLAGQSYQLQYATNLTTSNWFDLGPETNASGAEVSSFDSITNSRRFYRVLLRQ